MFRPVAGLSFSQMGDVVEGSLFGAASKHISGPAAMLLGAADIAMSTATAPRFHAASSMVGAAAGVAGGIAGGYSGAAIGAAIGSVVPGIGTMIGGAIGGIVGGMGGDYALRGPVEKAAQTFVDTGRALRHINEGGDYKDTEFAATMRQRAAREMAGSLMNARFWLGREAALFHQ